MTSRLTDEDVLRLQMLTCQLDEGEAPHGESTRRLLGGALAVALAELRTLRAAALSEEEQEALRWLVDRLRLLEMPKAPAGDKVRKRALAALHRLTAKEM